MNTRLWELYEQLCLEEMVSLPEFVSRLVGGEFGAFQPEEVIGFLRQIEANMLQNIQAKAMEHHTYAEMADQVSDETQTMFEELIAQVRGD